MTKSQQLTFDWGASRQSVSPEPQVASPDSLAQATLPEAAPENAPASTDSVLAPRRARPGPARLPVPRPLPAAVGRGNFGEDEHGPVRPSLDEVRAITEQQAERLIELLDAQNQVDAMLRNGQSSDRARQYQEKDRLLSAYQGGIALYAEDFGQAAANRLDAYVKHQVRIRAES